MRIACYIRCAKVYMEIREVLVRAGFACERFESEIPLLRALRRELFDLILADTDSHLSDEKPFYSWIKCRTDSIPVVLLFATTDIRSMAALAVNAGADDFINRPVDPEILIARLQVVWRRCRPSAPDRVIDVLGFTLEKQPSRLLDQGVPVDLTSREFALAWLFFSSPSRFLSHQFISITLWGVEDDIARHSIEQHVYKLRKKLKLGATRGVQIRNGYTKGYYLELCEDQAMLT
jgi:DNA-binding response OmpR family regulator